MAIRCPYCNEEMSSAGCVNYKCLGKSVDCAFPRKPWGEVADLKSALAAKDADLSTALKRGEALQARLDALTTAAREARDLIKTVHDFRLEEGSYEDGALPFGVIDYYGMEDIMKKIDAALAKEER